MPVIVTQEGITVSVSQSAPIGHNRPILDLASALNPEVIAPYLEDQFARHTARRDELLGAYKRFLLATAAGIPDEVVLAKAVDFSRQLRAAVADAEETRTRIKAPVLAAARQIDAAGQALNMPLVDAKGAVDARATAFMVEKDRREREAARLEAERKAEEAARLLDRALETGEEEFAEQADQADAEAQAAAAVAEAKPADLTRVRTALGSTAALRDNWEMTRIEDITKVPPHLLMVNEQAVRLAIRQGARSIPGLVIENKPKMR